MIKVLIIATKHFELDGITNVILNYYRAIDKKDMHIDFVVPNDIREDLEYEIKSYGSNIFKIDNRIKRPIKYIQSLSKLIEKNKYDIVHAHGNSYTLSLEMYSARKGGAKVRIPHSHNTKSNYILVHYLLKRLFNRNYTHGFACGQKAGEWLYKFKPFTIINNGIEVNKYKYNENTRLKYRKKYKLENKKVVGHIGGFNEQKNHEFLIQIFSELYERDNSYRLILIGDGKLRSNIEKQVKQLGLDDKVIFMGKTLDVPNLMQAMDMIIMPSKFEGLPLTLVEAQSACLQCFVSTAITKEVNITELIKFVSLEESSEKWAEKINNYEFKNREDIKEEVLKKIIKGGYSIDDNAKEMKRLYKKFIYEMNNI